MIVLRAVLVAPAASFSVTSRRHVILWLSLRMRKLFRDSLSFSVTFPPARTVNDARARVTLVRLATRTASTLRRLAVPVKPRVARRVILNLRLLPTLIALFV